MEEKLSKKKLIIESSITLFMILVLIILSSINKKGVDILKPEYIIIIIVLTLISTFFTLLSYFKINNIKITNVSYQISDLLSMATAAVTLVQIVFVFFVFPAQVIQTSMYPTLENEQMVICKSNTTTIERFDIVVVIVDEELEKKSNGVLSAGELIVKRVIGLPGEEIEYINNILYINGVATDEEFLVSDVDTGNVNKTILGVNEYLILGDHRSSSYIEGSFKPGSFDGRDFGAVNKDDIIGIVKYKMITLFNWEKVE